MSDQHGPWPPPPDCPKCNDFRSTEVFRRAENGQAWCQCHACSHVFLVDRHGQILHRADDVRG